MTILEASAETYHADALTDEPTLSASIAKVICTRSLAHARAAHPRLNPDYVQEDDQRFDRGTCAHSLLLEGVENVHLVTADNWRTKAAQEERDAARAYGRVPLLLKDWEAVRQMVAAAHKKLDALEIQPRPFTSGKPEQTLVWEMDGVWCRALIDWLHDDRAYIDDYKSTSASAHPAAWPKTALGFGADVQVAFHSAGVEAVFGVTPEWRYAVQEITPPYEMSVIAPDPEWLALGKRKVAYAVAKWREALASNVWPGYPTRVAYAELPAWAQAAWLEKEALEEVAA
jgi:hypothetical protein